MEKWTEIKSGFIPFGDYGIEINIDGDTLIAYLEDSEKFKFTFTKVWAFRSVYESLELIDSYWEQGLAKNRPLYLTNYIYEVENAEFGDLVASANIANKKLHHYKLMSTHFLVDVVSENDVKVEKVEIIFTKTICDLVQFLTRGNFPLVYFILASQWTSSIS